MKALKLGARMIARSVNYVLDHKASSVMILLLVIALIFVSTAKFSSPNSAQASQTAGTPPKATETYFKGQATYNSTMIWSVLSNDLKTRAEQNGATQADLQSQLNDAKSAGRSIDKITYIGAYNMQDGTSMHFYVATVRQSPTDTTTSPIFYVFTLDANGQITDIQ